MTDHDNADMLIKTINIWMFLQYFDELIEVGDEGSTKIVSDFFKRYNLSFEDVQNSGLLPLAQLKTTLSLLLVTLFFARWRVDDSRWTAAGMKTALDYDLDCENPPNPGISEIIRTLRNAAAHAFDEGNFDYMSFPEGKVVSFQTNRGGTKKVTFCTAEGFVDFLQDYIRAIKQEAVRVI